MDEELRKILSVFKKLNAKKLTTQEICRRVDLERETLTKYLDILLAMGEVSYNVEDETKFWYVKSNSANIDAQVFHSLETDENILANDLSNKIKEEIETPKLILIFTSSSLNFKQFLTYFKNKFGKDTKIAGTTTAGEFSNMMVSQNGTTALAFDSPNIDIGIGIGQDLDKGGKVAGKKASKRAYEDLDLNYEMFKKMPYSIATLLNNNNAFSLMFCDFKGGEEEEVIDGIRETFSRNCYVYGASSGDAFSDMDSFQFVGDKVYKNSVLVILFVTNAKVEFGSAHGWKNSYNNVAFVTKSKGRIVNELNGKRAIDVFAKKLDLDPEKLITSRDLIKAVDKKNTVGVSDHLGEYWLKHPIEALPDGSIKFFARVPQGVALNFMEGTKETLLAETKKKIRMLKKDIPDPAFVLIFNCVGRKNLLGYEGIMAEHEIFNEELKCPFIGFYSMGEQSSNGFGVAGHRNQSINFCFVSKKVLK